MIGTELGSYRIEKQIAQGGMGAVYLGVQPAIGSRVAIKVLSERCAADPALVERFFSEARAVNMIRHESIVNVLDMARLPDGRPYLVMELVDGQTLGHIVRRTRAPLGGVVRVVGEVLGALAAAHAIGIVHRDLKPDNILVTAKGHAKVLDFGIAKLARGLVGEHAPRTYTDDFLGTPAYMSPEQITNASSVDARTDLYAMGVVLYEAVTGRVPFIGTTFEIMSAQVSEAPRPPRAYRPDLPAAYEQVILTALAKDPAQRFADARAMAMALAAAARELAADQHASLGPVGDDYAHVPVARGNVPVAPIVETPVASIVETPVAPSSYESPARVDHPIQPPHWIARVLIAAIVIAAIVVPIRMFACGGETEEHVGPIDVRDPQRFDAVANVKSAVKLARQHAADAKLVEIVVRPVRSNGLVDLKSTGAIARYEFASKVAPCRIVVAVSAAGPTVERGDDACAKPPVPLPKCALGKVIDEGVVGVVDPEVSVVPLPTTATYRATPKTPMWTFVMELVFGETTEDVVADECEESDTNGQ